MESNTTKQPKGVFLKHALDLLKTNAEFVLAMVLVYVLFIYIIDGLIKKKKNYYANMNKLKSILYMGNKN